MLSIFRMFLIQTAFHRPGKSPNKNIQKASPERDDAREMTKVPPFQGFRTDEKLFAKNGGKHTNNIACRERIHIPPGEKENHQLKSAWKKGDMFVPGSG